MSALHRRHYRWLWLLLALWLTVLQAVAEVHASQHSLLQEHHNCLLCNFNSIGGNAPISTLPVVLAIPVKAIPITDAVYTTPVLQTLRRMPARGPPSHL